MTHWDELERELRLSVHPTFADKLLDNALESDNMLGAYGEIADLVAGEQLNVCTRAALRFVAIHQRR